MGRKFEAKDKRKVRRNQRTRRRSYLRALETIPDVTNSVKLVVHKENLFKACEPTAFENSIRELVQQTETHYERVDDLYEVTIQFKDWKHSMFRIGRKQDDRWYNIGVSYEVDDGEKYYNYMSDQFRNNGGLDKLRETGETDRWRMADAVEEMCDVMFIDDTLEIYDAYNTNNVIFDLNCDSCFCIKCVCNTVNSVEEL